MKTKLLTMMILSFSLHALAVDVPQIQRPTELEAGEFAEGTITTLSLDDIKEYFPWANNAKKTLQDALSESKRLPIRERMIFLENEVKSVVRGSAPKKYQQLMRFALNRGLLLVDILEKEANSKEVGIIQNQLDLLIRSIKMSFQFYESDLAFQKRAAAGNQITLMPQAELGVKLGREFLKSSEGVLDASAQYQVMKKTFEILNWDLSQDQESKNYSEVIVEIYKTISKLPVQVKSDEQALKHIRSMNYLKLKIEASLNQALLKPISQPSNGSTKLYQDPKSGLFWSDDLGKMNQPYADLACTSLQVGSKTWRLPTKEEYQQAEMNKIRKSLDFKNKLWWSSSVNSTRPGHGILFDGDVGTYFENRNYYEYFVRCVSSDKENNKTISKVDGQKGNYQDSSSGLFWSDDLGKMNHKNAIDACTNLKVEKKAWRLPTKEEYEDAEKNKIRDGLDFKGKNWWSSSVHAFDPYYAWLFSGDFGSVDLDNRDYNFYSVRCVSSDKENDKTTSKVIYQKDVYQDPKSKLFWSDDLGKMNHKNAIKVCANLKTSNKSWRLPTKKEFNEAIANKIYESLNFNNSGWWSSSLRSLGSEYAWVYGIELNYTEYYGREYEDVSVRCVAR